MQASGGGPNYGHGGMMGGSNFSGFNFYMIVIIGFMFVVNLILAFFVYRDCVSYNSTDGLIWALVVLCTSIIGVVLYLFLRSSTTTSTTENSTEVASNHLKIGSQTKATYRRYCNNCGTQIDNFSKFCLNCGASTD